MQLEAGRVGRPHGLDGSFHVTAGRADLLPPGTEVDIDGRRFTVERRGGTEARPVIRLQGFERREQAQALRGLTLRVDLQSAPALDADEYWAHELEGCSVHDGPREVGEVRRLMALPSCEVLEVRRPDGRDLLVPLVRDAVRAVDVPARRIEVDLRFLGEEA